MTVTAADQTAYEILHVRPDAHPDVVRAAYRALARLFHPDVHPATETAGRMAALNVAYARIGPASARAAYDAELARASRATPQPVPAPAAPRANPPADLGGSPTLDFGRYTGWTIGQLARHDPDYLRWLSRHSSGIRFRAEIDRQLRGAAPVAATGRFSTFRTRRAGAPAAA